MPLPPILRHQPRQALLPAVFCLAVAAAVRCPAADVASDSTYDTAVKLVQRAVAAAKDSPLSQNGDAAGVITALRSSHDRDLIPIFDTIAHSKNEENQIYGMVASAILYKESQPGNGAATAPAEAAPGPDAAASHVDMSMLLNSGSPELAGAAYASMIDAQVLSPDQLMEIASKAPNTAHRVMADAELDRLHKLPDLAPVRQFLNDPNHVVRYYAASVMLSSKDPSDVKAARATLQDLSSEHNLREAPVQALILVRMENEKQSGGIPWAAEVAGDDGFDLGLRFTAVSTMLSLHAPDGPRALAELIKTQHGLADQVKMGLIALAHPTDLTRPTLDPLLKSDSRLARAVAQIADEAISGGDSTADLIRLIKVGDPIILDWSLSYSDHLDEEPQLAIRTALVNEARVVDNERENDYENAALAAERMLEGDGAAGRKTVAGLLQSENRAVVEATLAGIYRSNVKDQSGLVMPIWDGLTKTTSAETAANYAALILAREGHKEPLAWLPGMVAGGAVQGPGFRALASWYYAKLTGRGADFLKAVLAN